MIPKFQKGDVVRLRKGLDEEQAIYCPEGRDNYPISRVSFVMADGGVCLTEDLRGLRYWHSDDLIKAKENVN